MREALAIVAEQGLDSMWKRHTELGKYLWAGLSEIGLEPYVTDPADRLITVNTIRVPKDIDAVKLITFAMTKFSLEISAGMIGITQNLLGTRYTFPMGIAQSAYLQWTPHHDARGMQKKIAGLLWPTPEYQNRTKGQLAIRTAVLHLGPRCNSHHAATSAR